MLENLRPPGPDLPVTPEPSWQRQRHDVITYPTSLAGSGTPRWKPGSRRHEHSRISSRSLARTCPSAHVNKCQPARDRQGGISSKCGQLTRSRTGCRRGGRKSGPRPKKPLIKARGDGEGREGELDNVHAVRSHLQRTA